MNFDVLFASVPVADLPRAVDWYEKLFGRAPDVVPNEQEVMWHVAEAGWLYVVAEPERAGQTLVSVCVADLDRAITELEDRGIAIASNETVPGAGRKAWLRDPDGNAVAVMEVL
ncbi:MAG TPA: VOC family protein [Acidimicrobiia bacterium]